MTTGRIDQVAILLKLRHMPIHDLTLLRHITLFDLSFFITSNMNRHIQSEYIITSDTSTH